MTAAQESSRHDEVWLLLPWLANGRLAQAERERVEEHVRRCDACERELALQHAMCLAFSEPDRVTYAPAPSFRKLMDRIDGAESDMPAGTVGTGAMGAGAVAGGVEALASAAARRHTPRSKRTARPGGVLGRLSHVSLWRPPGLAWAASFLVLFGITGLLATAYRLAEPLYKTHTDEVTQSPNILHIAFDRSLTIGAVEELLRASGARVVEGPGSTGIFGVTPVDIVDGQRTSAAVERQQMRVLSARLHADPRVLWVQPLASDEPPADQRDPAVQGR
jgi:hypothetical protein